MAKADFDVTLLSGEKGPDGLTYRPGEKIQGKVTLYTDEKVRCKHFYIRLGWRTEGRGTQHNEKVEELDVFQGELEASFPTTYDFAFTLPEQPWSYEGHYINVVWSVSFVIDVPWRADPKHDEPFILSPERGP